MKDYKVYSDEELIRFLREGEVDVTDYLINKYKPLVWNRAKTVYLAGGDTDDLLQEGMIGLFKAIRDYRDDRECSFFHFAELCIQRQMYKAVESSNRKKHSPLNNYVSMNAEDMEASVEQMLYDERENPEYRVVEQEDIRRRLDYIFRHLSKLEDEVFRMYLAGLDYTQIAERMGKAPKTVDNALQRIRQKVRVLGEKVGD